MIIIIAGVTVKMQNHIAEHELKSKRFIGLAETIDIKKLERETRKLLFLGFVVAIVFHASLFISYPHRKILEMEHHYISVELIVRRPRLTKPIVVEKKYVNKKFTYRKKFVPWGPSKNITSKSPFKPIEMYHDFSMKLDYDTKVRSGVLSDSLIIKERNFLLPKDMIPLKNQVFFDIEQHKSMIVVPPDNKMAMQGYTNIAIGSSFMLTPSGHLRSAARNLAQALMNYTNIHAEYDSLAYVIRPPTKEVIRTAVYGTESKYRKEASDLYERPFNSLAQYPFMYFTTDRGFELEASEKIRLGNYLAHGGFVILDNGLPEYGARSIPDTLIAMVTDSINSVPVICVTKNLSFLCLASTKKLPHNHPVYHCFFDFDNGPPPSTCAALKDNEILGIFFYDRLVGVYCPQGYGRSWNDRRNDVQLKMGVNLVVYALTRPQGTIMVDCEKERIVWRDRPSGAVKTW